MDEEGVWGEEEGRRGGAWEGVGVVATLSVLQWWLFYENVREE